jgi:signal transduction histidine kinase
VYSAEERALQTGIATQAAQAVDRARALEPMGRRAATAERERLAREIHDTLAQILGFVNIKTGVVQEWLTQGKVSQAQTELEQLSLLSQELYQDTRELVLGLHGEADTGDGISDMIQTYLERFSQFCNLPTTFDASALNVTLSPAVEVQLLRVVQEALSNVRKHARATHAWVLLTREQDNVLLEIRDDGQGFDPAHPARSFGPRFGLQSMRERVESLHGTFAVHSAHSQGTRIQVTVPLIYRGLDK